MPSTPAITGRVTITAADINGNSVATTFNNVIGLYFDYFKGVVKVVDSIQGEFFFALIPVTTVTVTVLGAVTTVVIS